MESYSHVQMQRTTRRLTQPRTSMDVQSETSDENQYLTVCISFAAVFTDPRHCIKFDYAIQMTKQVLDSFFWLR